jgi:hypothetical protein
LLAITMLLLGVFGIHNDGVNTAINVLILVLIVIWAALVFWTYADARRRIDDPMLVACATAASLFPFVGTIVYAIVRPPEYLDDVRLRDVEVRSDYLRCPSCMRRLKERCYSCGKPVDPAWRICPFCEAETESTPAPSTAASRRRRRSPTTDQPTVASEPPS